MGGGSNMKISTAARLILSAGVALSVYASANAADGQGFMFRFRPAVIGEAGGQQSAPAILALPGYGTMRVGTALTAAQSHVPSVSGSKTGDVYSLNQPLPAGLQLDASNGSISGTPAPGAEGIHTGFVMSVTDIDGESASSQPFALKVRFHEDPEIVAVHATDETAFETRTGQPFSTGAALVANPEAFIGSPVFSISGAASGLVVDPSNGSVSGTLSTGRTISLQVADDIGPLSQVPVHIAPVSLSISIESVTAAAGSAVDYLPEIHGALEQTAYSLEPWTAGAPVPEGIAMDPGTGRITGSMPLGLYRLKGKATDFETAYGSVAAEWRGTSDVPLALAFEDSDDQLPEDTVYSEIVPITGVPVDAGTAISIARLSGVGDYAYRTCNDPDCADVVRDWTSAAGTVENGNHVQIRTTASASNNVIQKVRLSVGTETDDWNVHTKPGDGVCEMGAWVASSVPDPDEWAYAAYGNGTFVALPRTTSGKWMTSPDGISWTAHTGMGMLGKGWQAITFGNGMFVAISSISNSETTVITSTDGLTWTQRTAPKVPGLMRKVVFGNGMFVAVGTEGTIMTSPDGVAWTKRNSPTAAAQGGWFSVDYGNGTFVAVASSGAHQVMTSGDGITWTAREAAASNNWRAVSYGQGKFVALAYNAGTQLMTSVNGLSWTAGTVPYASWNNLAFGGGRFVSADLAGAMTTITSENGTDWSTVPAGSGTSKWMSVTYGAGKFVALAYIGSPQVMTATCAN